MGRGLRVGGAITERAAERPALELRELNEDVEQVLPNEPVS